MSLQAKASQLADFGTVAELDWFKEMYRRQLDEANASSDDDMSPA